jgi:hypothetical protein
MIGRYKYLVGFKPRAWSLPPQQDKVAIAMTALNMMIQAANPELGARWVINSCLRNNVG